MRLLFPVHADVVLPQSVPSTVDLMPLMEPGHVSNIIIVMRDKKIIITTITVPLIPPVVLCKRVIPCVLLS